MAVLMERNREYRRIFASMEGLSQAIKNMMEAKNAKDSGTGT